MGVSAIKNLINLKKKVYFLGMWDDDGNI